MIVVTGATGHVGNNLVRILLKEGVKVRAMVHNPDHAYSLDGLDCERVYAELLDTESLVKAFDGAEKVYHCAALISIVPGIYDKLHAVNTQGVMNVIEACKRTKIKKLVHVASVEAIGNDYSGRVVDETFGFRPEHAMIEYGATKALGANAVLDAVKNDGLNASIVCPVGIVGPGDFLYSRMGSMLLDFCNGKLPAYPGGAAFVYVDVRDVAKQVILADKKGKKGESYLCSSEFQTMDDTMALFSKISGMPKPKVTLPIDMMAKAAPYAEKAYMALGMEPIITRGSMNILRSNLRVDTTKAQQELGMEYMSLEQSFTDAYEWFKARGDVKPGVIGKLKMALAS